jgi:hypothetical protein
MHTCRKIINKTAVFKPESRGFHGMSQTVHCVHMWSLVVCHMVYGRCTYNAHAFACKGIYEEYIEYTERHLCYCFIQHAGHIGGPGGAQVSIQRPTS